MTKGRIIANDRWLESAINIARAAIGPLESDRDKYLIQGSINGIQPYENDSDFLCQALGSFANLEKEVTMILQKVECYVYSVEYAKKELSAAEAAGQGVLISSSGRITSGRSGKY